MDYDQVVTQLQKIILLFSSEVGVVDVPEVNVAYKGAQSWEVATRRF